MNSNLSLLFTVTPKNTAVYTTTELHEMLKKGKHI